MIRPCTVVFTEICSRLKALIMLRHDFEDCKSKILKGILNTGLVNKQTQTYKSIIKIAK
jgi:hypothetical protein